MLWQAECLIHSRIEWQFINICYLDKLCSCTSSIIETIDNVLLTCNQYSLLQKKLDFAHSEKV